MPDRPRKLLVVDDNDVDRETIERYFGDRVTIINARTGAEGRELFARHCPDCVLLDYRLPDVLGLELLEHFAERGGAVVMLTGQGSESVAVETMKHGAYDYLVKGLLDRDALRRAVFGAIHRRSLANALGKSESYNRALLSAVPDTILHVHEDGRLLDFLPGKSRGLQLDLGDELGASVTDILPTDLAAILLESSKRAVADGGVHEAELTHERDGRHQTLEIRVTACGSDDVLAIIRDLTHERDLERRANASQRLEAMGRLAGGIAHDFRNILALVEGYAALLLEELDDPQKAGRSLRDDIAMIQDTAQRGTKLTAQLLAFSRNQVQTTETLDLAEKVRELEPMLQLALGHNTRLVVEASASRGFIEIGSSQLDQILMNLVVNARDAMPRGGRVTISTELVIVADDDPRTAISKLEPGGYIGLSITDTGEGMDEDTVRHIFEPFFTTKPEGEGTGLGLATVYGIVQQNSGHIEVTSRPGKGTRFTILFRAVDGESLQQVGSVGAPLRGSRETVLVVEDEEIVRGAVRRILARNGYLVLEASEAKSALAIADDHDGPIDLLLTDLVMPRIGGSELAQRIMARAPGVKVLFMSGFPEEVVAKHGVPLENGTFLPKPFEADNLLELVHRTLHGGAGAALNPDHSTSEGADRRSAPARQPVGSRG